ncbi:hypothetical protein SCHPADRAFT_216895 [Schizopora paradoxa]|uniref:Uncharacterized protein n=1 Tax=Schizopora paradoxa TaxID=27342 RepID=A0A0H2RWW1_9AGAM|nr:hypothetical protein SCHPADRAFT_216895 [Schizopora paradoxa]
MSEEQMIVPVPPPTVPTIPEDHQESRLHEQFSEDGRQTHEFIDVVDHDTGRRTPDQHIHDYPEFDDYRDGPRSILSDSLAKPASSGGRSSSNQRVTFIGELNPSNLERNASRYSATSTASKYSQVTDATEREYRHQQYDPQRHEPQRRYHDDEPQRRYDPQRNLPQKRLPYMILADFGNGLEIGNDVDGFMPYEDYAAYKETYGVDQDTYYIIPGNTPVVFHDEEGNELFRVDAHKYKTRRHKFIIQDEFGQELHRIGDSRFMAAGSDAGSSDSRQSRSKVPKLIHLDGRDRVRTPVPNSPRSDRTSSDIYVEDEYGRPLKQSSSDRNLKRGGSRRLGRNEKPNYMFVDEDGRPVSK